MRDEHAHIEEVMIMSSKIKATLKITKHIIIITLKITKAVIMGA